MLNPKIEKTILLCEQLKWKQSVLESFDVQQIGNKVKVVYGPRTYYIMLVKKRKEFWILNPFKDSVF